MSYKEIAKTSRGGSGVDEGRGCLHRPGVARGKRYTLGDSAPPEQQPFSPNASTYKVLAPPRGGAGHLAGKPTIPLSCCTTSA